MFVVVFQHICTDLHRGILVHSSLQILSKSLRFRGCRLATRSFSSLHRFSMGFRSGDWLGHSRIINMLLFEPFLCFSWLYVLGHCHVGRPILRPIFSALTEVIAQNFPVHGPIHPPLNTVKSSCPLSWETPPKHKVSTSMLHSERWYSWGCTQHFSSSKHGESSWCQIALFWSHLTTSPSPKPPPDHPGVLWQTSDRPVHVPSSAEEPCARSRILILHGVVCYWWFSSWLWSQLPSGH